jgi:glycosyltransferase involved in cell wall biosynthesis
MAARSARAHPLGTGIVIDALHPDYRNTPVSPDRPVYPYANLRREAVPLVSIVTPFFDTGDLFHETARSVLAQSLQSWEWLIVNDGSSAANALAILEQYRHEDERIRVVDLPRNVGPSAARNVGCRAARAPYLLMLDSDDLLEPTAAEKWWWFLQSYPEFGFVKGFSVGFGAMEYLASTGFHQEGAFLERNQVDVTSLVRAEVFRAAGGFPEGNRDGLEDWEFWLRCARAGFWGGTVPEYLSWYRRRDDDALRWRNWQGDGGSSTLRARIREEFRDLYARNVPFPSPRPPQVVANLDPSLDFRSSFGGAQDDPEPVEGSGRPEQSRRAALGNSASTRAAADRRDSKDDEARVGRDNDRDQRRLLLIVPWMTMGGADRFNLDLTSQLTARGWHVSIAAVLQGDMSWVSAFSAITPDVFILPDVVRLSDYPTFLRHCIATRGIDVVMISNAELGYRLLPYLRAQCPDVVFVDFCHMEQEEWLEGGYPRLSIEAATCLDRSILLSEHLRAWMIARGRAPEALAVSANGVQVPDDADLARQRVLMRDGWSAGETPIIVYAGRLVEQKQPHIFVEAVRQLWARGVDCIVVVAGDGPAMPGMRQRLAESNEERRVEFLGAVPPTTLDCVLSGADILCLPSKWEGIALVVQEAMARGVAVVAADVGGQRELVTPDCGVLIPPADDDALVTAYADQMQRLIREPAVRRRMGARARTRVQERFTLDQMGVRMDALLRATTRRASRADAVDPLAIVDSLRSQYVPYWQWVQQVVAGGREPISGWNTRMFRSLTILEPAYRWGLRRGWTWLPTLRRRLRGRVRQILRLDA